ncbi:hypothetical protein AN958_02224 [Leucoagaricus sp. SymC.cos]|nr:hypothetical protein AN958_02224 [Leucoagaricus sp. SymC.cos]
MKVGLYRSLVTVSRSRTSRLVLKGPWDISSPLQQFLIDIRRLQRSSASASGTDDDTGAAASQYHTGVNSIKVATTCSNPRR